MLDLIAVTIGTLTFIAWSAVLMFGGYAYRRRIERREQRARIAQWLAETRAKQAPEKVEPMQFTSTQRGGFSSAKIGKPQA